MADFRQTLIRLNENLNILREREAKYVGNAPVELLAQIRDHDTAIVLTEQAIKGELTEAGWRKALRPLLVEIDRRGQTDEGCRVDIGDVGAYETLAYRQRLPLIFKN